MLQAVLRRLTYANVIATLALFLALGGGAVWAANKAANSKTIGAGKLKPNAVTAGKIKPNAVTQSKIRANAVTGGKIREGAVSFGKLATGTSVIATAISTPTPISGTGPVAVPFPTTLAFTPAPGVFYLMSVEVSSSSLGRSGTEACRVEVVPLVDGNEWRGNAPLVLRAFAPTAESPSGLIPIAGETAPIGLTENGARQTIGAKLFGGPGCVSTGSVTVAVTVTQQK